MQSPNTSKNGSLFIGNNCLYSPKRKSMMYKSQSLLDPPSILEPRGSSTPLHSPGILFKRDLNSTPAKQYMSPSRYQLSQTPTTKTHTLQNSSGPLLNTTKFNVNVGTYMDALSPGLSERIVQYSNETKTHQTKYASPGQFPIVHFFKKDVPVLQSKPKKVTVRLASSYQSNEHNRLLMEGIMRENNHKSAEPINDDQNINDTGTRSVLDALKEISRKRIHNSECYEVGPDSYKRQRLDFSLNSSDNEESSTSKHSSISSSGKSKSVCVVDPITASLSSSFLLRRHLQKTTKRKKSDTEEAQIVDVQPKQLSNAETQTATTEVRKDSLSDKKQKENEKTVKESDVQKTADNKNIEEITTKEAPIKKDINILDVKMLEANKKKKLSKMLGVFGEKDDLTETPITDTVAVATSVSSDFEKNGPVSILSPMNKVKHTKHVTFNIPSETNTTSTLASTVTTTSSLVTPISSPAIIESPKSNSQNNENPLKMPSVSMIPNTPNASFKFGTFSNDTNNTVKETATSTPLPTSSSIKFGNGFQSTQISNTPAASFITTSSATSSPPKIGGFKFDLNKPTIISTTEEKSHTPSFVNAPAFSSNLKTPEKTTEATNATTVTNTFASSSVPFGGFVLSTAAATATSFSTPTTAFSSVTSAFGTPTTTVDSSKTLFNTSAFATSTTSDSSFSSAVSFMPTPSSAPASTPSSFSKSAPSFSFSSTFNKSPSFSTTNVSSSTTTSATAVISPFSKSTAFGVTSSSNPTTNSSSLFASNTQQSSTNTTSTQPSPAVATTASSLFGGNAFKDQKPSIFGGSNPALPFGSASNSGNNPVFGATKTKSGAQTTASITFGTTNPVMAFGSKDNTTSVPATTVQSIFAAKTEGMFSFATTSAPTFGVAKANTISAFSASDKNTANGPFGASISDKFGSNQSLTFPTTTNNMFGTTTKPSSLVVTTTAAPLFGTTTTAAGSVFGPNSGVSAPTFGGSTIPTTTTHPLFGATTTSAPAFGMTTTATSLFGTTTTATTTSSMFGTAVTTSAINFNAGSSQAFNTSSSNANLFGQNANNQFGSTPFGGSTNTNNFGGASSGFGAASFGSNKSAAPAFGVTQPSAGFGNTNTFTPSAFGGSINNNATNSTFGTNPVGGTSSGGVFSFGGDQAGKAASNVFAFGSSEASKPNFNFSAGGTGFGNNPTSPFGTGNSPSTFGSTASFGAAQAPAFGSGTVPNFGVNNAPTFGSSVTPQFNAPSPGMFSIGSGSTTSSNRTRTQLKGRRRT